MSFPAFEDFAADEELTSTRFRVYMLLQRSWLDHMEPRPVLVWRLTEQLKMRPASVITALNWLTEQGYIIEHDRGARGIRSFTLAWSRSLLKKAA